MCASLGGLVSTFLLSEENINHAKQNPRKNPVSRSIGGNEWHLISFWQTHDREGERGGCDKKRHSLAIVADGNSTLVMRRGVKEICYHRVSQLLTFTNRRTSMPHGAERLQWFLEALDSA